MEDWSKVRGRSKPEDARALQLHRLHHLSLTPSHPSQPSLPDHPLLVHVLRVVAATRILALLILVCLVTILGTCLCLVALRICLCLCRVRSGRGLPSAFRLGDYEATPGTSIRNERYKTKIPLGPTTAFGVGGELHGQFLSTFARGILGNISQYEGNWARW